MIQLPNDPADEWLSVLKPYQRLTINEFLKSGDEAYAIDKWFSSNGVSDTSKFGAGQPHGSSRGQFSKLFWNEFKSLICGDEKYQDEIKGFNGILEENKSRIVGAISTILAGVFGVTAIFIAPVIVLAIISITKVGVNAWCKMPPLTS
ncbi:hypothetical protein [Pantoea sp. WMus005]|uniref:hypothetical protein n=1 Tax=Pantoea TaxID=53335 RepID=UPI0015D021F3|nr:hypothetical protein [Pantoea sp. WMus005]NYS28875.1 hypothetical protein [Pantoea sp. WMus005]